MPQTPPPHFERTYPVVSPLSGAILEGLWSLWVSHCTVMASPGSWMGFKCLLFMVILTLGKSQNHGCPIQSIRWVRTYQNVFTGQKLLSTFWVDSEHWVSHKKTLTKKDLQNCFRKWPEWWDKYIQREWDYFDGINGNGFFTVDIFKTFYSNIHLYYLTLPCTLLPNAVNAGWQASRGYPKSVNFLFLMLPSTGVLWSPTTPPHLQPYWL